MYVVFLDDDVAKIDPDPEHDPLFLGCPGISLAHSTLHSDRTGDGLNDTRKFDQDAVAGRFDDAAFVLDDFRINEFPAMRSEPSQSASLVPAHQPRVAGHIGSENGSEPALDALSAHSDSSLRVLRGVSRHLHRTLLLGLGDRRGKRRHHRPRDLILHREDVRDVAIVPLGTEMVAGLGIDDLPSGRTLPSTTSRTSSRPISRTSTARPL